MFVSTESAPLTGPEVGIRPDFLVYNDAPVLGAAEEQWQTIAAQTGQTAPTLQQWRAARCITGNRPWPVQDARIMNPQDTGLMSGWDRLASLTENSDLGGITDQKWQEVLRTAGYPTEQSRTTAEQVERPRLAVIITSPDDDKISYLLQAIAHGTAIGAEVKAYGPSSISQHPRVAGLLDKIGLDRTQVFEDCPALSNYEDAIPQAKYQRLTLDLANVHLKGADFAEYLTTFAGFSYVRHVKNIDEDIAWLDEQLGYYSEHGVSDEHPRGLWHAMKRQLAKRQEQRQEVLDFAESRRLAAVAKADGIVTSLEEGFDLETERVIARINEDPTVDGALMLLPIGKRPDRGQAIRRQLSGTKDLDGVNKDHPADSLTARAIIETAERHLGHSLSELDTQTIFLAGLGEVGKEVLRQLEVAGITDITVLAEREDVEAYAELLQGGAYSLGILTARGKNIFDAQHIPAGEHGVLFVDAGGNLDPNTLDQNHLATPLYGGLGLQTVKDLFDGLIDNAREHWPKPRSDRFLSALGSFAQKHIYGIRHFAQYRKRRHTTIPHLRPNPASLASSRSITHDVSNRSDHALELVG